MSETDTEAPSPVALAKKRRPRPAPRRSPPAGLAAFDDIPERFMLTAKAIAVQNYNENKAANHPEIGMDDVHIVWFTKGPGTWQAVVASRVVRGWLWLVSYSSARNEAYIDVYRKLTHAIIPMGVKPDDKQKEEQP